MKTIKDLGIGDYATDGNENYAEVKECSEIGIYYANIEIDYIPEDKWIAYVSDMDLGEAQGEAQEVTATYTESDTGHDGGVAYGRNWYRVYGACKNTGAEFDCQVFGRHSDGSILDSDGCPLTPGDTDYICLNALLPEYSANSEQKTYSALYVKNRHDGIIGVGADMHDARDDASEWFDYHDCDPHDTVTDFDRASSGEVVEIEISEAVYSAFKNKKEDSPLIQIEPDGEYWELRWPPIKPIDEMKQQYIEAGHGTYTISVIFYSGSFKRWKVSYNEKHCRILDRVIVDFQAIEKNGSIEDNKKMIKIVNDAIALHSEEIKRRIRGGYVLI